MDRYVWKIFKPRDVSEKRNACNSKNSWYGSYQQLNTNCQKVFQANRQKETGKKAMTGK